MVGLGDGEGHGGFRRGLWLELHRDDSPDCALSHCALSPALWTHILCISKGTFDHLTFLFHPPSE